MTKEEGENLAKEYNISFFETSAKNNINVNETFNYLTEEILKVFQSKGGAANNVVIDTKDKKDKRQKSGCCK